MTDTDNLIQQLDIFGNSVHSSFSISPNMFFCQNAFLINKEHIISFEIINDSNCIDFFSVKYILTRKTTTDNQHSIICNIDKIVDNTSNKIVCDHEKLRFKLLPKKSVKVYLRVFSRKVIDEECCINFFVSSSFSLMEQKFKLFLKFRSGNFSLSKKLEKLHSLPFDIKKPFSINMKNEENTEDFFYIKPIQDNNITTLESIKDLYKNWVNSFDIYSEIFDQQEQIKEINSHLKYFCNQQVIFPKSFFLKSSQDYFEIDFCLDTLFAESKSFNFKLEKISSV